MIRGVNGSETDRIQTGLKYPGSVGANFNPIKHFGLREFGFESRLARSEPENYNR